MTSDLSHVKRNLNAWYMQAIDRRIEEAARANGLSEDAIALILGRS